MLTRGYLDSAYSLSLLLEGTELQVRACMRLAELIMACRVLLPSTSPELGAKCCCLRPLVLARVVEAVRLQKCQVHFYWRDKQAVVSPFLSGQDVHAYFECSWPFHLPGAGALWQLGPGVTSLVTRGDMFLGRAFADGACVVPALSRAALCPVSVPREHYFIPASTEKQELKFLSWNLAFLGIVSNINLESWVSLTLNTLQKDMWFLSTMEV